MSNEIVKVDFHGDTLEAMKDDTNKVWVSLRRCCENLGLDLQTQLRKLKGKGWACVGEMPIHDSSGRQQAAAMIDLDTLPGWLFSIDARKVKEAIREKLARYQREAARVLANHFLGSIQRSAPGVSLQEIAADLTHHVLDRIVPELRGLIAEIRGPQQQRKWTIKERCEFLGWRTVSARQRNQIRNQMQVRLSRESLPLPIPEGPSPAAELLYPESQMGLLDGVILRIWDDVRIDESGGMFATT